MTTYYVSFIAYDEETGIEVSRTIEPTENGLLRLQPSVRDIWAEVETTLQRERQKSASEKSQTPRKPKRRPTKRPAKRQIGRKVV